MSEHRQPTTQQEFLSRLSLAGNTDDIINWDALRKRQKNAPPALSEFDHCKLVLDAANGKGLLPSQWNQLVGATVLDVSDESPVTDSERGNWLNQMLTRFITASRQERAKQLDRAKIVAEWHTVLAPCSSKGHHGERRVIAENVNAGLMYGLYLVFHPQFAEKLSQCQYSQCKEFFFARPARGGVGRRSTRYCCPAHVKAGTLEQAKARMKKLREGRK